MTSRREPKVQARTRRPAAEEGHRRRPLRQRRFRNFGGLGVIAAVIVAVAIAMSSGASGSAPKPQGVAAQRAATTVDALLSGIPEAGNTIGSPKAKVTVTEFGDLQCTICRDFP